MDTVIPALDTAVQLQQHPEDFRVKANVEDVFYLSDIQKGLFAYGLRGHPDPYHVQRVLQLTGTLRAEVFEAAWQDVVDRHAMLRTDFRWEGLAQPVQVVYRRVPTRVDWLDWRDRAPAAQQAALTHAWDEARAGGFAFERSADRHLLLIHVADDRYWLVWRYHHVQQDGWSTSIVIGDLLAAYEQRQQGQAPKLPEAPSFHSYVSWLQKQDAAAADDWWRDTLGDLAFTTALPFGVSGAGIVASPAEQVLQLDPARCRTLEAFTRRHGLTLNTLVQGAWTWLLSRHAGGNDIAIGVTVSGRPAELRGVERIVGLFINTLPLRVRLPAEATLVDWLAALQAQNAELRHYEHTPLNRIQSASGASPDRPLFDSVLVFENYPLDAALADRADGLRVSAILEAPIAAEDGIRRTEGRNHYPLSLVVMPIDGLSLTLAYDATRFDHTAMRRLLAQFDQSLDLFCRNPDQTLGLLSVGVLPVSVGVGAFQGGDLVSRVAALSAARGGDVALVSEDERLDWAGLWRRSGGLVGRLSALGVTVETPVAVCLPRGLDLVVSVLAIWRAGGVYVPLDPSLPGDRLAWQMGDCGAGVLIGSTDPDWLPAGVTRG